MINASSRVPLLYASTITLRRPPAKNIDKHYALQCKVKFQLYWHALISFKTGRSDKQNVYVFTDINSCLIEIKTTLHTNIANLLACKVCLCEFVPLQWKTPGCIQPAAHESCRTATLSGKGCLCGISQCPTVFWWRSLQGLSKATCLIKLLVKKYITWVSHKGYILSCSHMVLQVAYSWKQVSLSGCFSYILVASWKVVYLYFQIENTFLLSW